MRSTEDIKHEDLEDYVDTSEADLLETAEFRDLNIEDYSGDDAIVLGRWQELWALQDYYKDFRDFYRDCSVELLGFEPTDMQFDIADYCQTCGLYSMIQAQRG